MAEEDLQALLERIREDGVERARRESEKILAEARAEADRIVREARERAEALTAEAERKAEESRVRGEQALRQAARDVVISLRGVLQQRVRALVRGMVREALAPERMGEIVVELARAYAASGMKVDRVEVLLPQERLTELRDGLLAALAEDLRRNTELNPTDITGGFQVVFNGEDVVYDFSDDALAETLASFLNPALAELIRPGEE